MKKIVTISGEFGSGGRELGRCLAEKLDFAYYDHEILIEIAKKTELAQAYVAQIVERKNPFPFPIHTGVTFQTLGSGPDKQESEVFRQQCSLSEKTDCVIVGCCADYILSDYQPYRIFVYSDMESKMERCRLKGREDKDLSEQELKRRILAVDQHRAGHYRFITGKPWGEHHNYDLCINTTDLSINELALCAAKLLLSSPKTN